VKYDTNRNFRPHKSLVRLCSSSRAAVSTARLMSLLNCDDALQLQCTYVAAAAEPNDFTPIHPWTSGQSNLAKAAPILLEKSEPRLMQCSLGSFHSKRDLDPCTVQRLLQGASALQRTASQAGRQAGRLTNTPRYGNIGRNSPHFMHTMQPKLANGTPGWVTAMGQIFRRPHVLEFGGGSEWNFLKIDCTELKQIWGVNMR